MKFRWTHIRRNDLDGDARFMLGFEIRIGLGGPCGAAHGCWVRVVEVQLLGWILEVAWPTRRKFVYALDEDRFCRKGKVEL